MSGAVQVADATPLVVQASGVALGVGVGDACPVAVELPHAAVKPMRTKHATDHTGFRLRTNHIVRAAPRAP